MFDDEKNLIDPVTDDEKAESAIAKELALRDLGDLWQDIAHESLESIKAYKRLLQTVEGTIEVIGRMVEQRDRYTYVHQKEVAELAVKIGKAMNLDDERIECIRVAGLLHDIGKIAVPIEILSKPDKISSFEMRILETHPRIGYDIIHGIPFPWPIDEIIYQHHERIDGSGYPRGLIGERIMTESKIIAVADVLNAMISHRPYRAAHPIGKALNFLIERKNVFFDGDIVDVCVSLFTTGEKTVKTMDRGKIVDALERSILSMAGIVEMRDPYIAGHQQHVADLCLAIANEMKLDQPAIDRLYTAACVHDIGKIVVPSEILIKPSHLNDSEMRLIRNHSQVGYDILRNMEFLNEVAQMVYQHHERVDGSGYPRGLAHDEIMIEARILALADVVEAMHSHRPYRTAPGLDRALEEISANKGKIYDPVVVNACVHVFIDEGFKF